MINIIIIDADKKRNLTLLTALSTMDQSTYINITNCSTADEARAALKYNHYNLMILNVVIPEKMGGTPSFKAGIELHKDIKANNAYLIPSQIISVIMSEKDIKMHKQIFGKNTFTVVETQNNSIKWIKQITENIDTIIEQQSQNNPIKKDAVLITLHGIRTYGKWQKSFNKVLNENTSNFVHYTMNYGFVGFFSVYFPFLRGVILQKAIKDIEQIIHENSNKDIHIIAHSFGTYIIIKFLMSRQLNKKIKTLILAASILPRSFFKKVDLTCNVERMINDCGNKDHMLFLNNLLSVKFGDSGRIGFNIPNNLQMCNRYFKGSHKLYFSNEFYKKFWLPYLISDISIKTVDQRR